MTGKIKCNNMQTSQAFQMIDASNVKNAYSLVFTFQFQVTFPVIHSTAKKGSGNILQPFSPFVVESRSKAAKC